MVGIFSIMKRIFAKLRKQAYTVRPRKHENDKNVIRFSPVFCKTLICKELHKIQNCSPYYKIVMYTKIHKKTARKNRDLAWFMRERQSGQFGYEMSDIRINYRLGLSLKN
jgi:hypothetical protein